VQRAQVEALTRRALRRLIVEQWALAGLDVGERTITSHLFRYMATDRALPASLSVDHEYNRRGDQGLAKRIGWPTENLDVDGERRVIPDIIIHRRGVDNENIAVVEAKRNGRNDEYDVRKVVALVAAPYNYRYGVLIDLGIRPRNKIIAWRPSWAWFDAATGRHRYEEVFDSHVVVTDLNSRGREQAVRYSSQPYL